jgi:hypothetical protein
VEDEGVEPSTAILQGSPAHRRVPLGVAAARRGFEPRSPESESGVHAGWTNEHQGIRWWRMESNHHCHEDARFTAELGSAARLHH